MKEMSMSMKNNQQREKRLANIKNINKSNQDMSVFENAEFGKIRTVIKDDEIWFVAKDISDILGYSETNDMTRWLDKDEKETLKDFDPEEMAVSNKVRMITLINESGLYNAVFNSKKPEAKRFKKWVTSEVLPSIRKTCKALENIEYKGEIQGLAYIKDSEINTTSLIIAKETGKEHSKVLRDIDEELKSIDNAKIGDISQMKKEVVYFDSMNRQQVCYEINEQLTMMLLARYNAVFRYKITKAFIDMRKTLIQMYQARALEQVLSQDNRLRQFVYVIGDPVRNISKIGVAQNVQKRLKQLQTGNSTELEILWISNVCSNAYEIEGIAHNNFKEHKILNEWFLVPINEIVNFLEQQKYILKSEFNNKLGALSKFNKC